MLKRIIFLIFLFLSLNTLFTNAQQFERGYIISNKNDTVNGWIAFQSESENSKKCTFKKSENADEEIFTPDQVSGYRFAETGRFFISRKLAINNEAVPFFLEFILKGKVSIYYYRGEGVENYFLQAPDGIFYEIKRNDLVKQTGNFVYDYVKDERYKDVLNDIFKDCPELKEDIKNIEELNRASLVKLTSKYNNLTGSESEKNIIYQKSKLPFKTTFILKGGMCYLYSALENFDMDGKLFSVNDMWSPLFGLQIDFFLSSQSPTLRLTGAVTVAKLQSENYTARYYPTGDVYLNKVFYNAIHYNLSAGAKYIYPAKNFRPYVGMGALCVILANSNIGLQVETRGLTTRGNLQNPNLYFFGQLPKQFGIYGDVGFELSLYKGLSLIYGAQAEYTKYGLGVNSTLGLKF